MVICEHFVSVLTQRSGKITIFRGTPKFRQALLSERTAHANYPDIWKQSKDIASKED